MKEVKISLKSFFSLNDLTIPYPTLFGVMLVTEVEYENSYDRDLKKEMWKVGKIAFENKEAFGQIQKIDPDLSKEIQKISQMKERELSLSLSRGGLSL